MAEKVAMREGFGAVLADGVKIAAEKIGRDADKYAIHIQGQELPAHDPRLREHWGNTYRLDPTPARHTQCSEGMHPPGLIPDRLLGKPPLKEGPLAGATFNDDNLIKEYFAAIDWEPKTAKPSKKKLQELGLQDVARELWP